jgi:Esterase-like activity of phytase
MKLKVRRQVHSCMTLAGVVLAMPVAASAEIRLIAVGAVPGTARDRSGLSTSVGEGQPHDLLGSFGSGVAWTGTGNRYFGVNDRGPDDGAAPYRCRMHEFEIVVTPSPTSPTGLGSVELRVVRTMLISSPLHGSASEASGKGPAPLMGGSGYIDRTAVERSTRFDPEGIRVSRSGQSVFVSEEYGPAIVEIGLDGVLKRRLPVPSRYWIAKPSPHAEDELPPANTSGRQANRGLEGLAVSPDGSTLWAVLQSPLIQDGALDAKNERVGVNARVLSVSIDGASPQREYVYQLSSPKHGLNEILAVDETRFLIIERDGKGGSKAQFKRVMLADFSEATDVASIAALPATTLPESIKPARVRTLIDLLDPRFARAGESFPEKHEALTFGPSIEGKRTLLVMNDNDLEPDKLSEIWVFSFDADDLPGLKDQVFDRVDE